MEAARAEAEASLLSMPRQSSLTRSMLVADLEVWERRGVGDDVGGVGKAAVEAMQKVEHELHGGDGVADLPKCISGALHLLGVGVDGEVALRQVEELLLEDDGVGLLIRLEQSLDGDVQGASVLIGLHGEVEDGVVDGAVHPAADAGVRLGPQRVSRTGGRCAVDVTEQPVLAAESGEEGLPLGVVWSLEAERDWDMLLDVDGNIRGVEQRRNGISHSTASSRAENARRSGGRGRRHRHGQRRLVLIEWSRGAGACAAAWATRLLGSRGGGMWLQGAARWARRPGTREAGQRHEEDRAAA